MIDDYWVHFTQTGNIYDYLKYKKSENELKAENNAKGNEGLGNQGAENRGE